MGPKRICSDKNEFFFWTGNPHVLNLVGWVRYFVILFKKSCHYLCPKKGKKKSHPIMYVIDPLLITESNAIRHESNAAFPHATYINFYWPYSNFQYGQGDKTKMQRERKRSNTFLAVVLHDWNPIQAFLCIRSILFAIEKKAPYSPRRSR